jgi:homoserine dehydrogenase
LEYNIKICVAAVANRRSMLLGSASIPGGHQNASKDPVSDPPTMRSDDALMSALQSPASSPTDLDQIIQHLVELTGPLSTLSNSVGVPFSSSSSCESSSSSSDVHIAVLADCSAGGDIASRYVELLARGIHVVTPNKQFCAGPSATYQQALALTRQRRALFFHEATVGAGLPIISTLKHLRATGDRIRRIQVCRRKPLVVAADSIVMMLMMMMMMMIMV